MPPRNICKERSSLERQTQSHDDIPSSSSSSSAADNFSSPSMKPIDFPPGFKFFPTDEDLLFHYLKPFSNGNRKLLSSVPIHRANIYESNPDQLTKKFEKGNFKEWFFITERTKVRKGGKMQIRSDNGGGYWNANSAPTKIECGEGVVGYKTKLQYIKGAKSDWLMHEYWFQSNDDDKSKVDHALCKIYLTPRGFKRKAEEEENEKKKKMKKEGSVATVDVKEEFEQPCNIAFQEPRFSLLPLDWSQPHQPQEQELQQQKQIPFEMNPHDSDDNFGDLNLPDTIDLYFGELINHPDDFELYLGDFNPLQLVRDEESTTCTSEANEEKLHQLIRF